MKPRRGRQSPRAPTAALKFDREGKNRLSNLLTVLLLVATGVLLCCYLSIAVNPYLPLNPFPPPTRAVVVELPTATSTPTPTPYVSPTPSPTPPPTETPSPTPHPVAYWSVEELTPNYPIRKIEVAGTYAEIGYAFGQWYREQNFIARRLDPEEREAARGMLALYAETHLGIIEQMGGIYAAYGRDLGELKYGIPVWKSWWKFLLPGLVDSSMCSVAFARPEMTVDEHARLGRNNDWMVAMPQTTLLFTYPEEEDAYPTALMTVGAPNFTAFDGLNSQGLALGIASVEEAEYEPPSGQSLIDLQAYRLVLETCANVEEAVAMLQDLPLAFSPQFGTHVLLADKTGDSAVVEFLPSGVEVSRTSTPYQVMTNKHWAGPADQPTCARYQTGTDLLRRQRGRLDTGGMLEVMFELHESTQWTIVYDLEELSLVLTLPDDGFSKRYEFSLSDFVTRMETTARPYHPNTQSARQSLAAIEERLPEGA